MNDHQHGEDGPPATPTGAEQRQRERKHVFCVNGSADFPDVLRQLFQEERYNVTTTDFVPRTFNEIAAL